NRRVSPDGNVTTQQMGLWIRNPGWNKHDKIAHEVIAATPNANSGRNAREVSKLKELFLSAGDRAVRRDVAATADLDACREITEIVNDGIIPNFEVIGMPN